MWLLNKMLRALIHQGQLRVLDHDGTEHRYGDLSAEPVTIRLTDKGAALHIARDPRVGAGEAYRTAVLSSNHRTTSATWSCW